MQYTEIQTIQIQELVVPDVQELVVPVNLWVYFTTYFYFFFNPGHIDFSNLLKC